MSDPQTPSSTASPAMISSKDRSVAWYQPPPPSPLSTQLSATSSRTTAISLPTKSSPASSSLYVSLPSPNRQTTTAHTPHPARQTLVHPLIPLHRPVPLPRPL